MINFFKNTVISTYLFVTSLVISIVITLNISPLLYKIFLYFSKIDYLYGMNKESILNDYSKIILYFNSLSKDYLSFDNFKMSITGKIHFLEVKQIFSVIYLILLICLFVGIFFTIIVKKLDYQVPLLTLNIFFYESLLFFCLLFFCLYLNFSKVFIYFHKIFFKNNYWLFDSIKDPIIKFLPESYFLFLTIFTLILLIFFSIVSKIVYMHLKHQK
ncbi:TIGR01906 family membrane protein [Clostridium perfringens]|uniref:TIGR01906 family membrane protein n=1 Tax=Clostridium perfringens TaxID=1502 RepID=UPI001A28AFBD|nr:TIGR01906 family membrane protein [Clostridium perfringens]MBO3326917.1 TIGR01906 family membrane protein [Clostridium perfringens]HAT4356520.1 TIGR01906 family membrane protein [Clostridium perfringens]